MTFEKAKSINIKVFVDAEESWIQPAIDEIVEEFMIEYNKKDVLIFNTVQMYRKGRLEYLKNLKNKATKSNFKIGIKLVRGAYMEKERLRARRMNYQSPICNSKEDTDNQYNKGLEFMFDNIDLFSIFLGSHNEQSVLNAILLADKMAISKNNQNLYFGQLFGMSDNLTFTLAKNGYNSVKYLPYGPVKDVIPFLIRRAEENTSVSGQTNRELELIKSEVKRRKTIA
jgi:proline dehydrogenase